MARNKPKVKPVKSKKSFLKNKKKIEQNNIILSKFN